LFNTTGADIINNAVSARDYEFGTSNAGAATFNMNATSTDLNIALLGSEGTVAVGDGVPVTVGALGVALAGSQPAGTVSTVNIVSEGDLSAITFNTVGTITAASGSTFNLSGDGNLAIAGFAANAVIDASALVGNLVIHGSQSFPYASETAQLVAGQQTGVDIITLGTGVSTIQFIDGRDSGVRSSIDPNGVVVDSIIGFTAGAGGDVLDWTFGAPSTRVYVELSSVVQDSIAALSGSSITLLNAATLAAAATADTNWTAFSFGGETYAYYDAVGGTAGTFNNDDILVRLVGVEVAELTAVNFA
jgi:hypothetical protein